MYERYSTIQTWVVYTITDNNKVELVLGFDTPDGAKAYKEYCERSKLYTTPLYSKEVTIRLKLTDG